MTTISGLLDLAVRYHQGGDLAPAELLYRQILDMDPAHADALNNLGIVLKHRGQLAEAVECYRGVLRLDPNHANALTNLGNVLKGLGQLDEAVASFRLALCINPQHAGTHNNLGIALKDQGQLTEAVLCFRRALQINPHLVDAFNNLGLALKEQGEPAEAAECFRQALVINPQFVDAFHNLGIALTDRGQLAEAVECFKEAVRLGACNAGVHSNLGTALLKQGRLAEARDWYEQALRLEPEHANARWNRSCLGLLQGELETSWPDFEYRWKAFGITPRPFSQPRWNGEFLTGKTILLHADQAFGDTLHFIRYAPLVQRRGGTVVFECPPALMRLLVGVAGIDQLIAAGSPLPAFDVQAPLMSLPGIFSTTLVTIPADVPYLSADPALVGHWHQELESLQGLKVGISWQGNPQNKNDRDRSIPLTRFEPLARVEGISLVSLQKGTGTEQLKAWVGRLANPSPAHQPPSLENHIPILDLSAHLETFLDTAAVMMNLDLVVTVDSAVAHLAGALGVPVWVVLPFSPDWRWLLERTDSPWFPSMRLFRQRRLGEWNEVIEDVAAALRDLGLRA